jgi:chromate transporter
MVLVRAWLHPGYGGLSWMKSAFYGIGAAVIAGAVVVLGHRALIDGPTWGIARLTLLLLWRARRIPEPCPS